LVRQAASRRGGGDWPRQSGRTMQHPPAAWQTRHRLSREGM